MSWKSLPLASVQWPKRKWLAIIGSTKFMGILSAIWSGQSSSRGDRSSQANSQEGLSLTGIVATCPGQEFLRNVLALEGLTATRPPLSVLNLRTG